MTDDARRDQASDQFLDLLLDALVERNNERKRAGKGHPRRGASTAPNMDVHAEPEGGATVSVARQAPQSVAQSTVPSARRRPGEAGWVPAPAAPSMGLERTLWRLLLLVVVLVVVVNIPVTSHGVSLARLLPDKDALIIRDGLLVMGEGPEVYVLMDEELHWIPTLAAFEGSGYSWDQVHKVSTAFLSQFALGNPLPQLIKCEEQPHVYRVNADGSKSWIVDIDVFVSEGYKWQDVMILPCAEIDDIPLGESVPPGRGMPLVAE